MVIEFKARLLEWAGREYRRLKSVQLEGPLLADSSPLSDWKSSLVNNR
jgi:hypothetical protein